MEPRSVMEKLERPCNYCGFARGLAGDKRRCGCGAAYCDELCQLRDWPHHKPICRMRQLNQGLQVFPRPAAAAVLQFLDPRAD